MATKRDMPHVAVLIETSRGYARALLRGVAKYNQEHGPWSIYFKPGAMDQTPPDWIRRWKGDGILARTGDRRTAKLLIDTGLPVVDVRGVLGDMKWPSIGVDNQKVAKLAVDHLLDRGLRRFAFVGLPRGEHPHMDQRCEAFRRLVESAGYECVVYAGSRAKRKNWETEQADLAAWAERLPKPIGVMACHDDRGQQVLDACRRAGVKVPDEVAVVGVDNDQHLCSLSFPPLTSVDPAADNIGYAAAQLLARMMRGERVRPTQTLTPPRRIVTRRSTDVLAIDDRYVVAAMRFIRERASDDIDVRDVLMHVRLSRSALERRFKKLVGRTPKSEILHVRVELAKRMLIETDLPLARIAERTGFRYPKYFSEVFHARVGVPPSVFRRQSRGEDAG